MTRMTSLGRRTAPAVNKIPVGPYLSEEYYKMEQEHIFRKCWLNVGSVHQIPNPGDYFVRNIAVLKMSILIVRGRDGVVRAFHNVCTHRNNLITHKPCGHARAFTCMIHGWTFDLQGNLMHVPPELELDDLEKSQHGLVGLPLDTWHGFIFIYPEAEPKETLKEYLGEIFTATDGHPLLNWDRVGRYSMHADCNWKIFQHSFIETAHVKTIHPRTSEDYAAEVLPPGLSANGRHTEMQLYANVNHQLYPVETLALEASPGFMLRSNRKNHPGLNPEKRDNWTFDQFGIFPNFLVFFGDGWCTSHIFWPDGVGKTYWEGCYYAAPATTPTEAMANHYFGLKLRDTVREDLEAVEAQQRGMRSGAKEEVIISSAERLLAHHFAVSKEYIYGTESAT